MSKRRAAVYLFTVPVFAAYSGPAASSQQQLPSPRAMRRQRRKSQPVYPSTKLSRRERLLLRQRRWRTTSASRRKISFRRAERSCSSIPRDICPFRRRRSRTQTCFVNILFIVIVEEPQ